MITKLRNPKFDKLKSQVDLDKIFTEKLICSVDGCEKQLTSWQGPGSDKLCRYHQTSLREYGGMGRLDRIHTIHRSSICSACGWNAEQDPQIKAITDDLIRNQVIRSSLDADHIKLRSEGGDNSEENIQTLCRRCHGIKTAIERDFESGKNVIKE